MADQFLDAVKEVIDSSLPSSSAGISKVINVVHNESSNAGDIVNMIE